MSAQLPLPTISIVKQATPDGQNVKLTLSLKETNSILINFTASNAGSVNISKYEEITYSNITQSKDFVVERVEAGTYTVEFIATNGSGKTTLAGTGFTILGVSGESIGPGTYEGGPSVPDIVYPPRGTLVSTYCQGTTKMGTYHDGTGGTYNAVISTNSVDCGYVPPKDPDPVDPDPKPPVGAPPADIYNGNAKEVMYIGRNSST